MSTILFSPLTGIFTNVNDLAREIDRRFVEANRLFGPLFDGNVSKQVVGLNDTTNYGITLAGGGVGGTLTDGDKGHITVSVAGTVWHINNNAITNAMFADGTVSTSKISDGAITSIKLVDSAVIASKIADSAVTTAKILDDAITTLKMANSAVTEAKVAANAITEVKILDAAIVAAKIAPYSVTASRMVITGGGNHFPDPSPADASFWSGTGTGVLSVASFFDATLGGRGLIWGAGTAGILTSGWFMLDTGRQYLVEMQVGSNQAPGTVYHEIEYDDTTTSYLFDTTGWGNASVSITASRGKARFKITRVTGSNNEWFVIFPRVTTRADGLLIVDGSIIATKIAAGAIETNALAANAVTAAKITAGTITANEIAAATITGGKIAATTITGSNIVALTLTAGHLAANTITASQIAAGTITATEIAASTITANRLNVSQLSAITADMGAITAGTITLPSGGHVKSGQLAYNTGTGFYLGNNGGTPVFSIGVSTGKYMTWSGSELTIRSDAVYIGMPMEAAVGVGTLSQIAGPIELFGWSALNLSSFGQASILCRLVNGTPGGVKSAAGAGSNFGIRGSAYNGAGYSTFGFLSFYLVNVASTNRQSYSEWCVVDSTNTNRYIHFQGSTGRLFLDNPGTSGGGGNLNLPSGTTSANGIFWGNDTVIYRSASGVLTTGALVCTGAIQATGGTLTGLTLTNCGSNGITYTGVVGTNRISFGWDGTHVRPYVDGTLQGTIPNP